MQRQRKLVIMGGIAAVLGLAVVVGFAQLSLTQRADDPALAATRPAPVAVNPRAAASCEGIARRAVGGTEAAACSTADGSAATVGAGPRARPARALATARAAAGAAGLRRG